MKRSISCITLALALAWAPTASAGLFEDFFQAAPPQDLAAAESSQVSPRVQLSSGWGSIKNDVLLIVVEK